MARLEPRSFNVRASACEIRHGRVVVETDALSAALVFVETDGCAFEAEGLRLVVRDLETGHEECFTLELDGQVDGGGCD